MEANAKEGISIPWPISYEELAPWYSYVEKFAGISGSEEGLAQLPDGEFQPAMDLTPPELDLRPLSKHNGKVAPSFLDELLT
jgi:choline dehydrogenase-like flavoprotein